MQLSFDTSRLASIARLVFSGALCLSLAGCLSNGTTTTNNSDKLLQGIVMIGGPVERGEVSIYSFNADGSRSDLLIGPFPTEQASDTLPGRWGSNGIVNPAIPILVVSRRGEYHDQSLPSTTTVNIKARDLLGFSLPFSDPVIATTPITHLLLLQARAKIKSGKTVETALNEVLQAAQTTFGFDVVTTLPGNPLAPPVNMTTAQQQYTALLGGMSRLLDTKNAALSKFTDRYNIVLAFISDLADGKLDGVGLDVNGNVLNTIPVNDKNGNQITDAQGNPIFFPKLTTSPDGIDVLFTETYAFAQNQANLSAANATDFPIRALRFDNTGQDFTITVSPNDPIDMNITPQTPKISWSSGLKATTILVKRSNNPNFLGDNAWVVFSSSGFGSPVTYFQTPSGANVNTFQMTNNGDGTFGESTLTQGITYDIFIRLTDNTQSFKTYTVP